MRTNDRQSDNHRSKANQNASGSEWFSRAPLAFKVPASNLDEKYTRTCEAEQHRDEVCSHTDILYDAR